MRIPGCRPKLREIHQQRDDLQVFEKDMAKQLKFFLFNCDNTYNLEVVEKFLLDLEEKYGYKFSIDRLTFRLPQLAEVCEKTLPKLAMDVSVFVVHADESRLSINEGNAGIGYARIYRALLQKIGGFWMLFLSLSDSVKATVLK